MVAEKLIVLALKQQLAIQGNTGTGTANYISAINAMICGMQSMNIFVFMFL